MAKSSGVFCAFTKDTFDAGFVPPEELYVYGLADEEGIGDKRIALVDMRRKIAGAPQP